MIIRLALLAMIIASISLSVFPQVTVTTKKVNYQRKGADVPEWKKEFEVRYPQFSGELDDFVKRRLEQTFSYWRVFGSTLEEETGYQWLNSLDYRVNYNKNGILELQLFRSGLGAYPSVYTSTIVADLNTGSQIKITDAFKDRIGLLTRIDEAQAIEMAVALKKAENDDPESLRQMFRQSGKASDQVEEFSVTDKGIAFLFDYEFPHAAKAMQPEGRYFFPWDQLRPYLVEFGKLNDIANISAPEAKTVPLIDLRIGGFLGSVKDGRFNSGINDAELVARMEFTVIGPGESGSGLTVAQYVRDYTAKLAAHQSDDICPDFRYVEVNPKMGKGVGIGRAANWDPVPRPVTEISNRNPIYVGAVSDFLKTKGLGNSEVKIVQAYKVDLEGDGTDEIIIRATNYTRSVNEMIADEGGYSFVVVRKLVDGAVKNILLAGDFVDKDFPGAENTHEVSAIADLNGDGKMEVLIYGEYYEGAWVSAYSIDGGTARAVLEAGCGV